MFGLFKSREEKLIKAILTDNDDKVFKLLKKDADINTKDRNGISALIHLI